MTNESPQESATHAPSVLSRRIPFGNADWQRLKTQLPVAATVNDLLLAATFVTLCRWNDQIAGESSRYWIRLAVPMDLAPHEGRDVLAANYSSMVFIDRRAKQIRHPAGFMPNLFRETQWIKQHNIGFVLLDVLRILDHIPGGMKAGVTSRSCASTAVVSNLGPLRSLIPHDGELKVGEARLKEFDCMVPIRPGTLVAIGVVTYAAQLHVCLHFDRQQFTDTAALSLFELLCSFIDDSFQGRLWTTPSLNARS